ncbi:unnamed protein product [Dovyalis caffra]|uniref:Uncharacterized protein n=1 Tax=Dovyalis caffra TaxID=77055 RepID=A0AAV1S1D6_9ROSI|nr:unnamed protein product [Dovyalis caffra]
MIPNNLERPVMGWKEGNRADSALDTITEELFSAPISKLAITLSLMKNHGLVESALNYVNNPLPIHNIHD